MNAEQLSQYDLWDLGAGLNSLQMWTPLLGSLTPLGISYGDAYGRIKEVEGAGYPMYVHDALDLPEKATTDYVVMSHFLEHLPDQEACQKIINYAVTRAKKAVLIMGPAFEDAEKLKNYGFQFHWDAWIDHSFKYGMLQVLKVLDTLGVYYTTSVGFPAYDSGSADVYTLDDEEAKYSDSWNLARHKMKQYVYFQTPLYREFMVCIPKLPNLDTRPLHVARHGPGYPNTYHEL